MKRIVMNKGELRGCPYCDHAPISNPGAWVQHVAACRRKEVERRERAYLEAMGWTETARDTWLDPNSSEELGRKSAVQRQRSRFGSRLVVEKGQGMRKKRIRDLKRGEIVRRYALESGVEVEAVEHDPLTGLYILHWLHVGEKFGGRLAFLLESEEFEIMTREQYEREQRR